MNKPRIPAADLDRLNTWHKYRKGLCQDCVASCCTLPVEVRLGDLIRMGLVDEFERGEPAQGIAKRLQRQGIVERFHQKSGIYTLARMANGDCQYLHRETRRCTIYERRPDTCRNHPQVGPRPGFCAYKPRLVV